MDLTSNTYLLIYFIIAVFVYIYYTWKWDKNKTKKKALNKINTQPTPTQQVNEPIKLSSNDIINEFEKEENPFSFEDHSNDLTQYELEDDLYTKKVYNQTPEIQEIEQELAPKGEEELKNTSAEDEFKNLDNLDFIKKISKGLNKN